MNSEQLYDELIKAKELEDVVEDLDLPHDTQLLASINFNILEVARQMALLNEKLDKVIQTRDLLVKFDRKKVTGIRTFS